MISISEAVHVVKLCLSDKQILNITQRCMWTMVDALSQDLERPWHPCKYEDHTLIHDGSWSDGRWYEWLDKYNNREVARMKLDAFDHFYPSTKIIKEENVIAFREFRRRV